MKKIYEKPEVEYVELAAQENVANNSEVGGNMGLFSSPW